jgi:TatD DNase family protein
MIDGHAHLDEIEDIDLALTRAKEAGVQQILGVGMDVGSNLKILRLAARFPEVVLPAIGYHPWSITAENIDENLAFIEEHLEACVALGEVGLDYGAKTKKRVQKEVFSSLLEIASKRHKPVIVHSRYSHQRTYTMVREAGIERAVFHWYSGPLEVLAGIIASGYYVSATPALAYSPPHREAIEQAPLDRILIETDSPVVYQGKRSEPADLALTLRELCRIKAIDPGEAARVTVENQRRLLSRR